MATAAQPEMARQPTRKDVTLNRIFLLIKGPMVARAKVLAHRYAAVVFTNHRAHTCQTTVPDTQIISPKQDPSSTDVFYSEAGSNRPPGNNRVLGRHRQTSWAKL